MDEQLIVALTPLIIAIAGLILQYLKSKDTEKHGDAMLVMLKGAGDTFNKVAAVLPQTAPYVKEYNEMVAEADKIWNSGGFTSDDIKMLELKAAMYKSVFDQALAKYRTIAPA